MIRAKYFSASGEPGEAWQLPQDPFDGFVHDAVLHQVIKAYLANQRQGNASTKSRGEVRGGGKKIWKQKGTGRARQGSIRAPHWKGGGVAHGPRPRDHHQDVPRRVKALARRSAFNTRALSDQVAVIERIDFDAPKTRQVTDLLGKIGIGERKVLILTDGVKSALYLSARNLPNVQVLPFSQASAYDVMNCNQLLIEQGAFAAAEQIEEEVEVNA